MYYTDNGGGCFAPTPVVVTPDGTQVPVTAYGDFGGATFRAAVAGQVLAALLTGPDSGAYFQWHNHETGEFKYLGYGETPVGSGWAVLKTPQQMKAGLALAYTDALIEALNAPPAKDEQP